MPDHGEDPGDVALVIAHHRHALAQQRGGDICLQIRKGQYQVGPQRQDPGDIGRGEGRDARLFLADPRGAHRIAGDPDNAILFA